MREGENRNEIKAILLEECLAIREAAV